MKFRSPQNISGASQQNNVRVPNYFTRLSSLMNRMIHIHGAPLNTRVCTVFFTVTGFYSNHSVALLKKIVQIIRLEGWIVYNLSDLTTCVLCALSALQRCGVVRF